MAENPNIPLTFSEQNINRAYETRRDTDVFKTPAITIYDVDYAIMYFLKNKIELEVEQNEAMIPVPVVYASAEIWAQIQGKGYMRDKQGKILAPYGVIRRTSMAEDERFKKLEVNNPPTKSNIYINPVIRNFENFRDRHQELSNSNFSEQFFLSVVPEFYKVEYELIFYTNYIEQMNKLVEQIIPASNFVWGDSWKFRTYVGQVSFDTVNPSNSERLVQCNMPLTVDARLQAEFELRKSTVQKNHSIKRIVFRTDRSSFDINAVTNFPGERPNN